MQLHEFSDASKRAYGAVIYLRMTEYLDLDDCCREPTKDIIGLRNVRDKCSLGDIGNCEVKVILSGIQFNAKGLCVLVRIG